MTVKQQIDFLKEEGVYNRMIKSGLLSLKVDLYYEIFKKYNEYFKQGFPKMDCATFTAEDFKVSESTVFNALNFMK